jgi:hypothetical protein
MRLRLNAHGESSLVGESSFVTVEEKTLAGQHGLERVLGSHGLCVSCCNCKDVPINPITESRTHYC